MKMSRFSLLLSAALFVAPVMVIADSTTDATNTQQTNTAEQAAAAEAAAIAAAAALAAKTQADAQKQVPDATKTTGQEIKDAAQTVAGEVSAEGKGIIAAITAFIAARSTNVTDGLDFVAGYTVNPVLRKIASFECLNLKGGRFENSIPTINKVLVGSALVAAFYVAYKAYVAQQDASNDDEYSYDDAN